MSTIPVTPILLESENFSLNLCRFVPCNLIDVHNLVDMYLEREAEYLRDYCDVPDGDVSGVLDGLKIDYKGLYVDAARNMVFQLVDDWDDIFGADAPVWIEFDGSVIPTRDYMSGDDYIGVRVTVDGARLAALAHHNGITEVPDGRSGGGFYRTCSDKMWATCCVLSVLVDVFNPCASEAMFLRLLEGVDVENHVTFPDNYPSPPQLAV